MRPIKYNNNNELQCKRAMWHHHLKATGTQDIKSKTGMTATKTNSRSTTTRNNANIYLII